MSLSKTILIAHRSGDVCTRVAAALADARHDYVIANTADAAVDVIAHTPISLTLLDLGLGDDPAALVASIRQNAERSMPVVIFAGTVRSGADIPALLTAGVAGYLNEHATTAQVLPALAPHLFPDNFDRRASARVTLGIPISYRAGHTIAGALTSNIGKGGVGVRTMSPLAAGTAVHVKFRLPGDDTDLEAEGRVAWSNRQVGMGIQFERIDHHGQLAIDRFVEGNS